MECNNRSPHVELVLISNIIFEPFIQHEIKNHSQERKLM